MLVTIGCSGLFELAVKRGRWLFGVTNASVKMDVLRNSRYRIISNKWEDNFRGGSSITEIHEGEKRNAHFSENYYKK